MGSKNGTTWLPARVNAGLNFYASVALVAGPTQLAIVEAVFPNVNFAATFLIATTVISLLIAPILTQFAFRTLSDSFIAGFLARALLTTALAGLMFSAVVYQFLAEAVFWLYLTLFLLLGLVQKVYFNVGWLHVMGAITPKNDANGFVANVRRVNGITTSVLSVGTLLTLQFYENTIFLVYVWICAVIYAFRSFWILRCGIEADSELKFKLQGSFARESTRYSISELLREFCYARTWRWLWPAILPTFLVPPVLFLYATEILALDWQHVLFVLLATQLFASIGLPYFVRLFRTRDVEQMRILLFGMAVLNFFLLVGNRLVELPDAAALGLIALNSVIAALMGETLGIVVHNEVVRIGISQSESPRTFVIYNFALDVFPSLWMVLGSFLIYFSMKSILVNPYEVLCLVGLIIFFLSITIKNFSESRRIRNG